MASSISAGTTSSTALVATADTTGALQLATNNGTVAVTVDTSQRVGIGTSSPGANLEVKGASGQNIYVSYTSGSQLRLKSDSGDSGVGTTGSTPLLFLISNGEVGRFDTGNRFLVGGTGPIVYSKLLSQFDGASNYGIVANDTSNGSNVGFMAFAINGNSTSGSIGTILRNGTANSVLYNTTSDQRLKENITEADAALGVVEKIKVRKYDWIEGKQHEDHGFIAQELAEVVNGVVSKGKTEDDMWAVDYGKLTPLLCKAIQELSAKVTALEAKVGASA